MLEVTDSVDIRDGCTRFAGTENLSYADGDEIRITGSTTRYVVVWVERLMNAHGQPARKRAYLLRHTATWPGP